MSSKRIVRGVDLVVGLMDTFEREQSQKNFSAFVTIPFQQNLKLKIFALTF